MGISGGAIVTIILTLYGKPVQNVVATASGIGVESMTAAALG
jgi:hypothetical protein